MRVLVLPLVLAGLAWTQDPVATPYWRSSFETGFPGEWLNYDGGAFSPTGAAGAGRTEHWTLVDAASAPAGAKHGSRVYKGWITGTASESHRAYPVLHSDFPSPLVNSWWVYLDTDYSRFPSGGWHHFATWGNNPDWSVQTMSVLGNGKLEMAHISNLKIVGDNTMPLRQWVRFTAYIAYSPNGDNTLFVWKDGRPCMRATNITPGGGNLMRSHWGLYTSANLPEGIQYNDDIQIWGLSAPWTDFDREPPSPYSSTSLRPGTTLAKASATRLPLHRTRHLFPISTHPGGLRYFDALGIPGPQVQPHR